MAATYEAYITLGASSVAVTSTDAPVVVRTERGDVTGPMVIITLIVPEDAPLPLLSDGKRSGTAAQI